MTTQHDPRSPSASLSAMFDGEATEKDIELLLGEQLGENNSEWGRQLDTFQLIRNTLQNQTGSHLLSGTCFVDNIRQAIDAEETKSGIGAEQVEKTNVVQITPESGARRKSSSLSLKTMFSSLAIAASVSFVVIFSGDTLFFSEGIHDAGESVASSIELESSDVEEAISLAELESQDVMPADNIRLQHYLRQHAEQSAMTVGQGMMPMARVVSYPVEE